MGSTITGGTLAGVSGPTTDTYEDIFTLALMEIGAIGAGDTASASDIELARKYFNLLIDQWKLEKSLCYVTNHESFAFATSKQTYTIGPTGDFVTDRPIRIDLANLIIVGTDDVRMPLEVINDESYSAIPIPAYDSAYPVKIYYRPTYPNGTIYPWPYPTTVTNKLELFTTTQLSEVAAADITNTISFAPGYRAALLYSLAKILCGAFEKEVSQDLALKARESKSILSSSNARTPRQCSDIPGSGGNQGLVWNPVIKGWY
jgi:hypothetical protein